jgi:hypothetical protein
MPVGKIHASEDKMSDLRYAIFTVVAAGTLVVSSPARASAQDSIFAVSGLSDEVVANLAHEDAPQAPTPRPVAIEHSAGYETRAKIHKYASFATLPLFGTELLLGQSLYNNRGDETRKGAHLAVGAAIGGLFAVNSVTGIWNLWESRNEPGKTRRLLHGILMLSADAGFLATAATGPGGEGRRLGVSDAGRHRAIAITSISVATASYLIMLLGNH